MGSPIIVSAHIVCFINNKVYAKVTDFTWTSNTPRKEIRGLDQSDAYELAPTTASVSGTLSVLRLREDGGLEGDEITAPYVDIVSEKYFTLLLIDRKNNQRLFEARQCSVTTQTWNIPAKGMVTGSFSFQGVLWNNESVEGEG